MKGLHKYFTNVSSNTEIAFFYEYGTQICILKFSVVGYFGWITFNSALSWFDL